MKTGKVLLKICSIKKSFALFFAPLFVCLALLAPAYGSPRVSAFLDAASVSPDKNFNLYITISWQGAAEDYIIIPPAPVLPEGIKLLSSSFSSSATASAQQLQYQFILRAEKEGVFTIQPAEIKYWAKGSGTESSLSTEGISCAVDRFSLVKANRTGLTVLCLVIIICIIAAGVMLNKKRRAKKAAEEQPESRSGDITELLERCRQCKIKGDHAGFYRQALAAAKKMFGKDKTLIDNLADMLEKVEFGGHKPQAEETDRIFRQLQKKAEELPPDENKQDREYLKYCK